MPDYTIPNLKNACRILVHLKGQGRALNVSEISKGMRIPRTTARRIAETLSAQNFMTKEDGKYALGPELISLGECACARVSVADSAVKHLARLTQLTGETSHIGVYAGSKVLIARVCESPLPLYATSRAGAIVQMYCSGTGKVLLANMFNEDAGAISKIKLERRTEHTISSREELAKELKLTQKRGYALDNEEFHPGVRCLAAPVFDKTGAVVAALGITAPASRFEKKHIPAMAKTVQKIAEELSRELGKS